MDMIAVAVLAVIAMLAAAGEGLAAPQMLANAEFGEGAEGWTVWTPAWKEAAVDVRAGRGGLTMEAPGEAFAVGGVWQEVGVKAGEAYRVEAECRLRKVPYPHQAVGIRVDWLKGGELVNPHGSLVRGPVVKGERGRFGDVVVAPEGAETGRVILETHWLQGGSVTWKRVSMAPTARPERRKAKIGTVYLRPQESTPERNLELWCEQVREAGKLGLDAVCLCEAMLMVGTGKGPGEVAETIPGPSTRKLGEAAREAKTWVVAGLMEQAGDRLYNTAVLIDREGKLAGKYRKTHLPREEWRQGVTPGDEYPVFETDFGTIGIQICYDWFFPEVAAALALQGAEVIFAPTWGTTFPDEDGKAEGETVFRVRARDNGVYLVPSVYDGSSMVIDPLGRVLASNEGKTGVFWAEVELGAREPLPWVGHWRSIGPRDRMPWTYGGLVGR